MATPARNVEAIADVYAVALLELALLPFAAWLDAHPGRAVNEYDAWRNPPALKPLTSGAAGGGGK